MFQLGPDEETATIELFAVTHSAIGQLPDFERRLITLVDIESVPLDDAAKALRVGDERAAQALNHARIHVRGAIEEYLSYAEA
jgi:DNA-directed RNA polymerase specialized sigma24 family protein